ncbi:hypothetical protein CHS0354_032325 [Potamilus streckersoni]|uniref:Uncharacterized protein n=1 Tax=Potamilus streckersoni TaxID=2493646 RepID=A0AAE0RPZ0_9BIVA|nr:hypothetical protein CHS0354_032325 [Potamilus streckersoni]
MMRKLFGKMFSFLVKREETKNQSKAEPSQSALESLMSMATAETNDNNSATVGDDASIIEPTSPNISDWENIQLDFASKPSTSGVQFSDEPQPLMESQGKVIGKQIKAAQQINLESFDIGIPPNEFMQQNINMWEEIAPNFVIQEDINSSGKTSHHDKSGNIEILEHSFVHQSEKSSQEVIPPHNFLQITVGGHSSLNEDVKVNLDESNKDFEIQPSEFCMSNADKIETLYDTQGHREAGSEIGVHAFIQQDFMENAEIPPPIWAVLGQETSVATTTAFANDATHKDGKCTKLSYQSPVLKEINSFEREDGSEAKKQSNEPYSAAKSPGSVDKLIKEKDLKNDDLVNFKRDVNDSDMQTGARHGKEKDKDSVTMKKGKSNRRRRCQNPENWRSREPKDEKTAKPIILKRESEDWRRERQPYIEEPKDLGEYLSFVDKMTEIGQNVKAKDLVYKLGYLKNVEPSKIEEAILKQYRVAVAKKSTGWIKDARYFCEILFPQDWIDENLVPLDGKKDSNWKKKKPQQNGESEEKFTHLSFGEMCRDVRLKSDPTLSVIRVDMGSGNRGQKSEKVLSGMLMRPSTRPVPIGKQGSLQDLERLENFVSGIACSVNEKASVIMEEEDKENAPLEVGIPSCMGKVISRNKETCSEEDPVHEIKLTQDEDGSIVTSRKRGEELAIGFNYHSDVLAKESSPLKVEATDQNVPCGHGKPDEDGSIVTPRKRGEELAIGFNYHSDVLAKESSPLKVEATDQNVPCGHRKPDEDGSIVTPRKRGEELAIGFNYHSDVLAKESSPLKVEATDQDLPCGHGEPLDNAHRHDSLCNTPGSRKASNDQLAIGFSYHSEILAKDSSFSVEKGETDGFDLAKVLASVVLLSPLSPLKGEQAIASFIQCEEVPEKGVSNQICEEVPEKGVSDQICEEVPEKGVSDQICEEVPEKGVSDQICEEVPEKGVSDQICEEVPEKGVSDQICEGVPEKGVSDQICEGVPEKGVSDQICEEVPEQGVFDQIPSPSESLSDAPAESLW